MRLGNIFQPKLWIQVTGCFRLHGFANYFSLCDISQVLFRHFHWISKLPQIPGATHHSADETPGTRRTPPGQGGPAWSLYGHCMVSVTCLSLFSSHSLCTLKLTLTEMSFLKQHLPLSCNCLLNTRGDSCSLAESWAVTGAGACALYCAVQSAVHSTDARCRLARHNDRDQSLV